MIQNVTALYGHWREARSYRTEMVIPQKRLAAPADGVGLGNCDNYNRPHHRSMERVAECFQSFGP